MAVPSGASRSADGGRFTGRARSRFFAASVAQPTVTLGGGVVLARWRYSATVHRGSGVQIIHHGKLVREMPVTVSRH